MNFSVVVFRLQLPTHFSSFTMRTTRLGHPFSNFVFTTQAIYRTRTVGSNYELWLRKNFKGASWTILGRITVARFRYSDAEYLYIQPEFSCSIGVPLVESIVLMSFW